VILYATIASSAGRYPVFWRTTVSTVLVIPFRHSILHASLWVTVCPALTLLTILGVHEMGHYVMARRHKADVTLPYFIPMPFGLGTMGAVIRLKSPIKNRRQLFDIGVAGPLAGLAVAIPLLIIGLSLSPVQFVGRAAPGGQDRSSYPAPC
jgi:Zn-dependent protease